MIEIDGVELRTAAQWEKKHRHVKKGQLGKGVERTWRSPNGNTTAMFYNIEQTRPWAKKDVEAVNRRRRADAKAKREADECGRIEGNNFDIGQLEQLSTKDKQDMLFELVGFIMCERFETINDFTAAALREFPEQYREIIVGYNSILERYCRGNYLNAERKRKRVEQSGAKE